MVELIVIVALLGLLVMVISPRISWMEPPKRVLQRSLLEAVETARKGVSMRFRADATNGEIIPEILVKGKEENREGEWTLLNMQYPPLGNGWKLNPEIIYFFQDGTCSPAKISYGIAPEDEKFLLTVTAYMVENKTNAQ